MGALLQDIRPSTEVLTCHVVAGKLEVSQVVSLEKAETVNGPGP